MLLTHLLLTLTSLLACLCLWMDHVGSPQTWIVSSYLWLLRVLHGGLKHYMHQLINRHFILEVFPVVPTCLN